MPKEKKQPRAQPDKVAPRRVRRFFAELGPGLITGAADDDPSGISTYSVTGASFGYAPLWTALFSFPLMTAVQRSSFIPHLEWSSAYIATFVGILGTTISPYLFFWQASQEVEEERKIGRNTVGRRKGASDEEMRQSRTDVVTGMFFSNFVMYFIILTTAATLHARGQTHIETALQAA